jgi:hypothetical protein
MESATSPEFFPPLDRPVDRVDAMTRWVNSFPHRHVGPNEGVESALPMAGGPPIARLKAAPAASRYLLRLLLVVPTTRPRAHCACLWSLRPLRRLRWAPPSLWLCLGALLLFRGCLTLCVVVIVGFIFAFTLLCCRPILSLSSFSPCLRSAPRVLPWFGTVGHRFSALIVRRIRFIFSVFAFSSIHGWGLQNWLPSLTVFPPTCSPDLVMVG